MEKLTRDEAGRPVLPQPEEIPTRDRDDAMGSYLMMFGSWAVGLPLPIISMIVAGVYHAMNGKKSRFVAFHSYQSMITEYAISSLNLLLIAYWIVLLVRGGEFPSVFWAGLVFAGCWNIAYIVFSIIGAVRAYKGRFFYFPFFGRLAFARYYGDDPVFPNGMESVVSRNEPPRGY